MKKLYILLLLLASFSLLKAQSQYRSLGTGVTVDLSSPANWQVFSAGAWVSATAAPTGLASGSTILIQAGDTWANGATASTIPSGVTLTNKSNLVGSFATGKITNSGTLIYSGTAAQVLPPSTAFVGQKYTNLTINNPAGVKVGASYYTIAGILYLQSGAFNTNNGGSTFFLSGTIQSGGGTINSSGATTLTGVKTLVNSDFIYSSVVGQMYAMNVGQTTNPGNISTTGAFTIYNNFNLTAGTLNLGGPLSIKAAGTNFTTLTNTGSIVAGNNAVSFDGTAKQAVLASGFFANNSINNLVINNTTAGGAVSYPTKLTIGSSLTAKLSIDVTPLTVNDTVTIGGALNISFATEPTLGQTYTIISGAAISGTFNSVSIPTLAAGYTGVLDYTTNTVKLTIGLATPPTAQDISDFSVTMNNIRATFGTASDATVATDLAGIQTDGHWTNINYDDHSTPIAHWDRISNFCRAYSRTGSLYYGSDTLRVKIIKAMTYWRDRSPQPSFSNWYVGTISLPKAVGTSLIAMRYGPTPLDSAFENSIIDLMTRATPATALQPRPLSSFSAEDGSNLTDVAQHTIMRACLKQDPILLNQAITSVNDLFVIANNDGGNVGSGLQADNRFTLHGPQLYIYGYGSVLVGGTCNIVKYINGTSKTITADKIAIFSNFVRKGLLKVSRGKYHDFNAFNRQISRLNEEYGSAASATNAKSIDLPEYAAEYDLAISRLNGTQLPSYLVAPEHIHFWRTDYTVHHRPKYMFGLRSVSTRTTKSENGNGENLKGYYVTDGANYIAVNGDEYYNIYPVWEWNKIPGTTIPESSTIPLRQEWNGSPSGKGTASFVGGVSDGIYGVSAYAMNDYNTQAKKSWFFFDDEVVCLGAGINSTAAEAINTTVNQCLLDGEVNVKTSAATQTLATGSRQYNGNLQWANHDNVGYFFPQGGNISLSNQAQTGSQVDISTDGSTAIITKNVFKLWFQHGVSPSNSSYAYIVSPGKTLADMDTYNAAQLQVVSNSATTQAVYHAGLNMLQVVFYQAGSITCNGIIITADAAGTILIKNLSTSNPIVSVSDPTQLLSSVNVTIKNLSIGMLNNYTATLPTGLMAGSTITAALVSENAKPTVSITSPAANASYGAPASVTINANATDADGVNKVEFFQGETKLGESLTAPYNFVWNNVVVGNYTLTAMATDNNGAVATSAVVNISVQELTIDAFVAIGDAYVAGGNNANANFPTGNLTVKNAAANLNRRAFIQFDLDGYGSVLDSAFLKLTVGSASSAITTTNWEFYEVPDNNWTETNITWNNQKAIGNLIATLPGKVDGSTILVPITGAVSNKLNGDKKISVRISSTVYGGNTDARFVSRENSNVNQRPTLILYGKMQNIGGSQSSAQQSVNVMQNNMDNKIALKTNDIVDVKAYPNPSADYFTAKLPNDNNEKTQLRILDMAGRVVKTITNITGNTVQFGQELRTGLYLLEVRDGNKRRVVKLIKL